MGNFRSCRGYFTWLFSFNAYKGQKMSALVLINSVEVEFKSRDESVFIDSLALSRVFEKRHDHVLKAVENLPNDEFKFINFEKTQYLDKKGELRPCYNLTKDGFCLLVMGFTGEKAYKFKVEFIKAFNRLIDENKRLKFSLYTDKIANLQAINKSKATHHQNVINGYKSQISQKNKLIAKLKESRNFNHSIDEKQIIALSKVQKDLELMHSKIGAVMASISGDDWFMKDLGML